MLCSYEWIIQSYFPSYQQLLSNPPQTLLKRGQSKSLVAITFLQSNDSHTLSTELRTSYRSIIAMPAQLQLCNCTKIKERPSKINASAEVKMRDTRPVTLLSRWKCLIMSLRSVRIFVLHVPPVNEAARHYNIC